MNVWVTLRLSSKRNFTEKTIINVFPEFETFQNYIFALLLFH